MSLTEEQSAGLNVALNEAELMGLEIDPVTRSAIVGFRTLTLPEIGPANQDRTIQFVFRPVSRVVASLREGLAGDHKSTVVPFTVGELGNVVQSFGGLPIYGWEFVDVHAQALKNWGDRLSLDWKSGDYGRSHSITVFQDSGSRILDLCMWFDELAIFDPEHRVIPLDTFIAGGKRWWDAFHAGDERTEGHGMSPLKGTQK